MLRLPHDSRARTTTVWLPPPERRLLAEWKSGRRTVRTRMLAVPIHERTTVLTLKAKFVKTALLPGKEEFPPSCLASLLDTDTGEVLNLIGPAELHEQLGGVEQFDDVAVQLRWRRIDLRTLGGSGRGKAYRLQMTGLLAEGEAS